MDFHLYQSLGDGTSLKQRKKKKAKGSKVSIETAQSFLETVKQLSTFFNLRNSNPLLILKARYYELSIAVRAFEGFLSRFFQQTGPAVSEGIVMRVTYPGSTGAAQAQQLRKTTFSQL